jgi:nucleotide-binding universal stress UspA family protein
MAEHLRSHGVPITIRRVLADSENAGETLIRLAAETNVDLIVAGGYGHSRIREWVLGGATDSLLHTGALPCLLSH